MKKIAIIPARSGSKGLPNKNVLLANGKPIISYTIEAAINARCFDKIIVSTDSQEYIDLLSAYPIEFIKRAEHLATDNANSFIVIEDVINQYTNIDFDYFVLLQPTSPLRTQEHIIEACATFEKKNNNFDFLVSVTKSAKHSSLIKEIDNDESLKNFNIDYSNYFRQSLFPEFSPNGAIFIGKKEEYLHKKHFFGAKSLAYKMDKISSLDIDEQNDFEYFYFLLQQKNKENILRNSIQNRIELKKENFNKTCEITFIGHSILDQWNITNFGEKKINNLAISGISTREYINMIIDSKLLKKLGKQVFLMHGTNDVVKPNWTNTSVLNDIQELVNKIKNISAHTIIYFLEITPTAFRLDRNNDDIMLLNQLLKTKLNGVQWIDTYHTFTDKYGKLNLAYSDDGLHLNKSGYEVLKTILIHNI